MPPVVPLKNNIPAIIAGGSIAAVVPANVRELRELADMLADSDMIPAAYKKKPGDIVVGVMFGMELGLPPLASLRHVAVINGKPSLYGDGQLGVAMGKGQLEDIEEKIEGDGENMKAVCRVRRRNMATDTIRVYSVADAKKAGLWGKAGPWTQHPKRMLQMRARSFALRDTFADYLLGLSAEEARDIGVGPDNARDVTSSVEPTERPASRLDAFEQTMGGDAPMPADETFVLPATDTVDADGVVTEALSEEAQKAEEWGNKAIALIDEATDPAKIDAWLARNKDAINKVRAVNEDAAMAIIAAADYRLRQLGAGA